MLTGVATCSTASDLVGADDYIAKPFHLREVLARVKSVLRRREPPTMPSGRADEVIRFEGWRLDVVCRQLVSPTGEDVALTSGEFDLLAASPGIQVACSAVKR